MRSITVRGLRTIVLQPAHLYPAEVETVLNQMEGIAECAMATAYARPSS